MRVVGVLLILFGTVIAGFGYLMPTTVDVNTGAASLTEEPQPRKVHNIGLMEQRRDTINLGAFGIFIGVLLFGFGTVAASRQTPAVHDTRQRWLDSLPPPSAGDATGRR